jgi:hypothetical protein
MLLKKPENRKKKRRLRKNLNVPLILTDVCLFLCMWQLLLSNPGSAVIEKLHSSKLTEHIGNNHIFLTVADAVRFCTSKSMQEP